MRAREDVLLTLDAIVNLLLGILLMLHPAGLADALGLPPLATGFYPTVLGGVLFGVGLALGVERYGKPRGVTGLSVAGAVLINLSGGGLLLLWLTVGNLDIPVTGRIILWALTITVLAIGLVEAASSWWRGAGLAPETAVAKLREATAEDSELVVDLVTAMLLEMASHGGRALNERENVRSQLRERFLRSLQEEEHTYLVAPAEGREGDLAGVVEARLVRRSEVFSQRPVVHIHSVYVRPSHRRRGLGRAMLEDALAWGRDKGCAEAELHVLAANPARQVYQRIGFEVFELAMRLRL